MSILKRIKRSLFTRQEVFEINNENGLLSSYAIRTAQGEGGQPDPKLAARLAWNARKLAQQREEAHRLKSNGKADNRTKDNLVAMPGRATYTP